jgi:hypothetical protein
MLVAQISQLSATDLIGQSSTMVDTATNIADLSREKLELLEMLIHEEATSSFVARSHTGSSDCGF